MEDLIALHCPACGGNIQIEASLEKIFCTHCGTQLLLKHGADGLLVPLQARDLTASARMQETEAALILMDTLKAQVQESESQVQAVKVSFWKQVMHGGAKKSAVGHLYSETEATRRVNQYTRQVAGVPVIVFSRVQLSNDDLLAPEKLARSLIAALTTPDELLAFYKYLIQPQGYDQTAYQLATTLHPLTKLAPELKEKKERLKQVADGLFEQFIKD